MILKPLRGCTEFVIDGTHGSPERTPTGIPVLSATNVRDGCLSYETERAAAFGVLGVVW